MTEELAAEFGSVAPSSTALAEECSDLGEAAPEWSEEIDAKAIDAKSAAADAFSNQVLLIA